jgi:hypothetical protein
MLEIVDMNYPGSMQLPEVWNDIAEVSQLPPEFYDSAEYRELKSTDLSLLTEDLGNVKHAVNHFIEIGHALEPRTEHEIPRLRALAYEIDELIKAEYTP